MGKTLLLFVGLLVGCGADMSCLYNPYVKEKKETPHDCTVSQVSRYVHSDLAFFVASFSTDARSRQVPCYHSDYVTIQTKDPTDPGVAGYCLFSSGLRVIQSVWDNIDVETRRTLIYHELGHCALHQGHVTGVLDIMNPYLAPASVTSSRWEDLVNTLFSPERNPR